MEICHLAEEVLAVRCVVDIPDLLLNLDKEGLAALLGAVFDLKKGMEEALDHGDGCEECLPRLLGCLECATASAKPPHQQLPPSTRGCAISSKSPASFSTIGFT